MLSIKDYYFNVVKQSNGSGGSGGGGLIEVSELPEVGEEDTVYKLVSKPTQVPNSGYVERVYFNTSLSEDEYYNILKNITFTDGAVIGLSGISFYASMAYMNNSNPYVLGFMKYAEDNIHFGLINFSSMLTIQNFFLGGWEVFDNPYSINSEVLSTLSGLPIGTENDKLANLISTTPFEAKEEYYLYENGAWVKISGDNEIIEVEELPTTNIDSNAFYKTPRKFTDVFVQSDNYTNSYLLSEADLTIIGAEIVDTKPTTDIVESNVSTAQLYLYYATSENDIFAYINMGAGASWYNIGTLLQLFGQSGLTFVGETTGLEKLLKTTIGYYAYFEEEKYYKENENELTEYNTENEVLKKFFSKQEIEKIELTCDSVTEYAFNEKNVKHIKIIGAGFANGNQFIVGNNAFIHCNAKTIHITHKVSSMELCIHGSQTFSSAINLANLVLDFATLDTISDTNNTIFSSTPIAKGTGYIYVRDEIVEEVKALDGWSTYASQIKPLSEYVEE